MLFVGLERKPGNGVMGYRCNSLTCALVALVLSLGVGPPARVLGCDTDADCEDNNPCTDDRCIAGVPGGPGNCWLISTCSDGLNCNGTELCCTASGGCGGGVDFGQCQPGVPTVCTPGWTCVESQGCVPCQSSAECVDGDPCTEDYCNPGVGCENPPYAEGTSCDDGNACTILTECAIDPVTLEFLCSLPPPPVEGQFCNTLAAREAYCGTVGPDCDPECLVGMCTNPNTGTCMFVAGGDGNACNDGDVCTPVDECQNGVCVGGSVGGCLDLEFRVAGGQTVSVGDIVEIELHAMPNGCPPPPEWSECPIGTQGIESIEAVVSWDPAVFEVWDPGEVPIPCNTDPECPGDMYCDTFAKTCARFHRLNPDDPCDDIDACNLDCGSPGQQYNWASSLYPADCQAPFPLNRPCTGIPENDGNLKYTSFAQFVCNGSPAPPACASASLGLWISTLKFQAIAPTVGLSGPSAITLEDCLLETRTRVNSGDTPGLDITGSLGQPALVEVECVLDSECPFNRCIDGVCPPCPTPEVEVQGCRYISVTPQEGVAETGILVTGVSPDVSCVSAYVLADQNNRLAVSRADFQPPGPQGWGTVQVHSDRIFGSQTYNIFADCDSSSPGTSLSEPVTVTMSRPGDADFNDVVDILDVTRGLDGFRAVYHTLACETDGDCWQVRPFYTCDTDMGMCNWIRLEHVDIIGDMGCTPDRIVSILDVMLDLDYFRSLPRPCPDVCP